MAPQTLASVPPARWLHRAAIAISILSLAVSAAGFAITQKHYTDLRDEWVNEGEVLDPEASISVFNSETGEWGEALDPGAVAPASFSAPPNIPYVKLEVTNVGRSAGLIRRVGVETAEDNNWFSTRPLCDDSDNPNYVPCDMPIKVEPAQHIEIIFSLSDALPYLTCNEYAEQGIIVIVEGVAENIYTGSVGASLADASYCPTLPPQKPTP